jgi:glycosyltransferase involved in cell wall biosynthesis
MRIAVFAETFLPKWDGVATTLCYLLEHLAKRQCVTLMFAPQGAPSRYADTPIVGLPSFAVPLYPDLKLVSPFVDVRRQLTRFKPDLVHLVNPASLGWVGLHEAQRLKVPIVASYHTDIASYTSEYGLRLLRGPIWSYFRHLHNQADLNLCPSCFTKRQLEAQGFQRVHVWGRGVDTARFNPCHRKTAWRIRLSDGNPDKPLLLYVGRLAVEKRVDWLRPLLDILPNVRLAIVGDGPLRASLARRFAGTPTVFTGYLRGEDLSSAYASADLFVFPSASETFGNVVLEAMASGLPVIAPRYGGPVDHVSHGVNGFLFNPDQIEDMIALVWQCVADATRGHPADKGHPADTVHPADRDPRLDHWQGGKLIKALSVAARDYALSQGWEMILDHLLQKYIDLVRDARYVSSVPLKLAPGSGYPTDAIGPRAPKLPL